MPLEPPDQQRLKSAHGYIELGMWREANAELEEIDAFCRHLSVRDLGAADGGAP